MSDTINCPNCSATLPSAASFCTSCGNRIETAAPAAPPPPATFTPPPVDPTQVGTPGLHDATQVYSPPPAPAAPPPAPPQATSPGAGASAAPWQPAAENSGSWGAPTSPPETQQVPAWVQSAQALSNPMNVATPPGWQEQAVAAPPSTKSAGSPLAAVLAALGGVLTLIGTFMPWIGSNLSDAGLSGWDLTSGDKGFLLPDNSLLTFESMDPYVLLALGVAGLLVAVMSLNGSTRSLAKIVGLIAGVAVIGFMIRDWTSLASVVKDNAPGNFEISSDFGFYLSIAGGAVIAFSALMPAHKPSEPTPV